MGGIKKGRKGAKRTNGEFGRRKGEWDGRMG